MLDHAAINTIVSRLDATITDLEAKANSLGRVGDASFGGSWPGAATQTHTSKAYEAIQEALTLMRTGILDYIDALTGLASDAAEADGQASAAQRKLAAGLQAFDRGSGRHSGSHP